MVTEQPEDDIIEEYARSNNGWNDSLDYIAVELFLLFVLGAFGLFTMATMQATSDIDYGWASAVSGVWVLFYFMLELKTSPQKIQLITKGLKIINENSPISDDEVLYPWNEIRLVFLKKNIWGENEILVLNHRAKKLVRIPRTYEEFDTISESINSHLEDIGLQQESEIKSRFLQRQGIGRCIMGGLGIFLASVLLWYSYEGKHPDNLPANGAVAKQLKKETQEKEKLWGKKGFWESPITMRILAAIVVLKTLLDCTIAVFYLRGREFSLIKD